MPLDEISITDVDLDFVSTITLTDIYGYMTYLSRDRVRYSEQPQLGLRTERRVKSQKNRHNPLFL